MISGTLSRRAFIKRTALGGVTSVSALSRITRIPSRTLNAQEPHMAHRFVTANGIRMHLAEQGRGPVVLLCHGFPELWYSWRHQLNALADAGFHAVAPDLRGYGQTDRPADVDEYTTFHEVGDMVGVLDALGVESAVIAGHDFGAVVAWQAVLLRPDRFRAIIALSVPFTGRGPVPPTSVYRQTPTELDYRLYFQAPGVAEAELERDVRDTMRRILASESKDGLVPRSGGFLTRRIAPASLPLWLTEADVEFYAAEHARTGFRAALNSYRNSDRNWELQAPFAGVRVPVPALFMIGDQDVLLKLPGIDEAIKALGNAVPRLWKTIVLPGCGHRIQQERPNEVNAAMIEFLKTL
jgi:pimeloyl-ACP methyl ester carboxylesterase